jgi:hypothetical protein
MGDGADMALYNATIDYETFDRWKRNGSDPQEGYDLGFLDENGIMMQFPTFSQSEKRAKCKYCNSTTVYWIKCDDKWVLSNTFDNKSHRCKEYSKKGER